MKAAIAELRDYVSMQQQNKLQSSATQESHFPNCEVGSDTYARDRSCSRGRGAERGDRGCRVVVSQRDTQSRDTTTQDQNGLNRLRLSELCFKKEKVDGAHRVWGTFSVCSASALHSTIKKLCGTDSMRVRKKSKELGNGKMCWWFVLHDEIKLQAIDEKWEHLQMQTGWKLEPQW